jgi:Uma2 family endonuclease
MPMGSTAGGPAGKIVLSHEDYVRLPADGKRYELLEGEVYMAPAPSPRHQDVSRNLGWILDGYVRAHRLGKVYYAPIDAVFRWSTVVQPNLILNSGDRLDIVGRHNVAGAPDLRDSFACHRGVRPYREAPGVCALWVSAPLVA